MSLSFPAFEMQQRKGDRMRTHFAPPGRWPNADL